VGEKVLLTGFISDDDRDKLFKIADCAVFPSLYEPFGIVALEAMAARCPVIVSAVGGLQDVVEHNETGIVVYPNNVDSLAWGIVHTLQHPKWSAARVENAYRVVRERYNWEHIARTTAEVYRQVIAERRVVDW
jgi:glycogen(starch) synthase